MKKRKVLLVEDDLNLGTILKEYLEVKGFDVIQCMNGEEGLKIFKQNDFDISIIDIMMPKMDGFSLARQIKDFGNIPFIFLTAKSLIGDKVEGFQIGADDYITKPFSMEELILRINAVLNRSARSEKENISQIFNIGKYLFNYKKRVLLLNGKEQKLTSKESELLKLLCENKNVLVERSSALAKIWRNESYFTSRSMDVYIAKLRNYLKSDSQIEIINVHGSGFKLLAE